MLDADLGQHVARRLADILKPAFDDITAKLDAILAKLETSLAAISETKDRLLLIEQHHQACPHAQAQAQEKGT
jgi:hypothetical protein